MSTIPNSHVTKAVIYVVDTEDGPEEAIVMMMKGSTALMIDILGPNVDESNDNLVADIFTEETDSRFMSPEFTSLRVKNIEGAGSFIAEIGEILQEYDERYSPDYILYKDNQEGKTDFFDDLEEYLQMVHDDLTPIHFRDIFIYESDIAVLLKKFDIEDHMYSKQSPLSCAFHAGILFDLGIGR